MSVVFYSRQQNVHEFVMRQLVQVLNPPPVIELPKFSWRGGLELVLADESQIHARFVVANKIQRTPAPSSSFPFHYLPLSPPK